MEILNRTNSWFGESSRTLDQEISAITHESAITLYSLVNASKTNKIIDAGKGLGLFPDFWVKEEDKCIKLQPKIAPITQNPLLRTDSLKAQDSDSSSYTVKEVISGEGSNRKVFESQISVKRDILSHTNKEATNITGGNLIDQQQKVFQPIKDLDQLPFEDNSLDAYTSNLTFQFNPNYLNALWESYRVLSKGGRTAFSIWGREENWTFLTFLPNILESHGVIVAPENEINFDLISIDQVVQDVKDIGFRIVKKIHIPFYYFIMDAEEMWDFLRNSYHRKQLDKLDEATLKAVKEDVFREFDSRFGDQTDEMIGFEVTFILAVK